MTDLTEQMKKGELPEGYYYVKDGENMIAEYIDGYFYNDGQPMTSFSGGVDEVLAPVPSYEEWQASENYIDYLKQCISVYESKDKQATETSIAYNELLEENAKLKSKLQLKETTYDFDTARLEEENAQLKTENKWYSEQLNEAVKEIAQLKKWCEEFNALEVAKKNAQLKELLKECRKSFNKLKGDTVWCPYEVDECITKIDEVLK